MVDAQVEEKAAVETDTKVEGHMRRLQRSLLYVQRWRPGCDSIVVDSKVVSLKMSV